MEECKAVPSNTYESGLRNCVTQQRKKKNKEKMNGQQNLGH